MEELIRQYTEERLSNTEANLLREVVAWMNDRPEVLNNNLTIRQLVTLYLKRKYNK